MADILATRTEQKLVSEATGRDRPQQDVDIVFSTSPGEEEGGGNQLGSSLECKICLDSVRDPVVTSCGHLFCWPCLYRWFHARTGVKECPVCKRKLTIRNLTPIYGHGNGAPEVEAEDHSGLRIPIRPHARRPIQRTNTRRHPSQRTALQRPGSRFGSTRNSIQTPHHGVDRFMPQQPAFALRHRLLPIWCGRILVPRSGMPYLCLHQMKLVPAYQATQWTNTQRD